MMEYWDKEANEGHGDNRRLKGNDKGPYVVPCGQDGSRIPVGKRKDFKTEVDIDEGKITFATSMSGIEIYNESKLNNLTYTINSIPVVLAPGDSDRDFYEDFTEVTITGTSPDFTCYGLI